jgi:UMF1 family MFS transporter
METSGKTAGNAHIPPRAGLLNRIGLHRPELRAWAMYDWAASSVQTTIMVAVFPIYFITVAGTNVDKSIANQHLATANAISVAIVALLSPVLGAIADYSGRRKQLLAVFLVIGVFSTAGMFFIDQGDLRLAELLYVLAMSSVAGSYVFYESLLPHIASEGEMDRVSTAGYAIGYTGGGVLLALNLAWIQKPEWFGLPSGPGLTPDEATLPVRLAFLSVAVWWLAFSIPLFRGVREPARMLERDETARGGVVRHAFVRLGETFHELRGYRHAFLMLLAFLFYNDGISTIQKMAASYAKELEIADSVIISAILIVQFLGIPFSFLFGMLAGRIGTKRAIFLGLLVYTGISILGYRMATAAHFYLLAALVGMVQGGTQALSRSLFANMIPRHKSGEFFGFFSVFNKFAGIFGPLLFALVIGRTGSSRHGILSIIAFFALGGILLAFVNVRVGEQAAREAERRLVTDAGG